MLTTLTAGFNPLLHGAQDGESPRVAGLLNPCVCRKQPASCLLIAVRNSVPDLQQPRSHLWNLFFLPVYSFSVVAWGVLNYVRCVYI